eukprot:146749_1
MGTCGSFIAGTSCGDDAANECEKVAKDETLQEKKGKSSRIIIQNDSAIDLYVIVDFQKQIAASNKSSSNFEKQNSYSGSIGVGAMGNSGNVGLEHSNSFKQALRNEKAKSYDIANIVSSGKNTVPAFDTEDFPRYDFTYITVYYSDNDIKDPTKEPNVWDRRYIVPDEDVFIFDGKHLRCKSRTIQKYITKGTHYILPAVNRNKTLIDTTERIVIEHMRNTPAERFELIETKQNWVNVRSHATNLFWTMTKEGTLSIKKFNYDERFIYEQEFKFESIAGSDTTIRIRSRYNGIHLMIIDRLIVSCEWDPGQTNPKKRFILQEFEQSK